jgi:ditrans,polycis-polyprenyl diphosphate synthase
MLSVCYGIGVKEISAYLFSLENFKRSPQEVEDLMRVMESSLKRVIQKGGLLHRLNIQLRVVGRRDCLPKWFLEIIDEAICLTSRYNKLVEYPKEAPFSSVIASL